VVGLTPLQMRLTQAPTHETQTVPEGLGGRPQLIQSDTQRGNRMQETTTSKRMCLVGAPKYCTIGAPEAPVAHDFGASRKACRCGQPLHNPIQSPAKVDVAPLPCPAEGDMGGPQAARSYSVSVPCAYCVRGGVKSVHAKRSCSVVSYWSLAPAHISTMHPTNTTPYSPPNFPSTDFVWHVWRSTKSCPRVGGI
jgi:hypothetical protein